MDQTHILHIPVLLDSVLQQLDPQPGETYLDLTAGYGGHAARVLQLTHAPEDRNAQAVLVDRDSNAIGELEKAFKVERRVLKSSPHTENRKESQQTDLNQTKEVVTILQNDFLSASQILQQQGRTFDMILADLGVSSPHLNDADRGFAIAQDGPLDMRMDQTQGLSAADIVNSYSEDEIAKLLADYGEEPKARQIARSIVQSRPFTSTTQLAKVVAKAWPGRNKVHPATRTFQALRIAVNDELHQLQQALPLWQSLLAPGGRLAVISFHSLEDRIVKQFFADASGGPGLRYDAEIQILTKRPITASPTELVSNPRARSAKLRAVAKRQ